MLEQFTELYDKLMTLLTDVQFILEETIEMINGVTFQETMFDYYLGLVKYAMGTPLWTMFTTVMLIPLGVTVFVYLMYIIDKLRGTTSIL